MRLLLFLLLTSSALFASPARAEQVQRDLPIRVSDGTTLLADAHLPDAGCPRGCPVVMTVTPYSKNKATSTSGRTTDPVFPDNGLVQLVVDARGTGASEGVWCQFCAREQQDYGDIVRWAAEAPFGDGRVVAYGASYGAIAALQAAQQPGTEALKAIYAIVPLGDTYRDIFSSGGNPNFQFLSVWGVGLVSSEALAAPTLSAPNQPGIALNAASQHALGTGPHVIQQLAGMLLGRANDPERSGVDVFDGDFYRERSVLPRIDRIKVPTFLVGGQSDIFQRTQPMLFEALELPADQKKLILTPGYHTTTGNFLSSNDGERTVRDDEGTVLPPQNVLAVKWFERWLSGRPNEVDALPPVAMWWRGEERFVAQDGTSSTGAPRRRLHLSAESSGTAPGALLDGELSDRPGQPGAASLPWNPFTGACARNPTQYLFGAVPDTPCSTDDRVNETGALTFTTKPADEPQHLTGPVNLRTWVSSTRPDTNVVAILTDVAPDGRSEQVSYGVLLGSQRAVDERRCRSSVALDCTVYGDDGDIALPFHPFTRGSAQPMNPGELYELRVELLPFSLTLRRGHRLRLSVLTGDFPNSPPTATLLQDAAGGTTRFVWDEAHPSYVSLGQWRARPKAVLPASLAGLAASCASRRRVTIRLRGRGLRSVVVRVDGRRVRVSRRAGRLTAVVDVRGRARRFVRVTVAGRSKDGRVIREARSFRTCGPGPRA